MQAYLMPFAQVRITNHNGAVDVFAVGFHIQRPFEGAQGSPEVVTSAGTFAHPDQGFNVGFMKLFAAGDYPVLIHTDEKVATIKRGCFTPEVFSPGLAWREQPSLRSQ